MNPSSNEAPSMQLPPPVAEQAPTAQPGEAAPAMPEQLPAMPEAGGLRQPAAPAASPLPLPQQDDDSAQPVAAQPADDPISTQSSSLPVAQDSDLIEKEWVTKAKSIVDQTKEDPYKQSEALTMFKADYMKKRYNKTIKQS